MEIKKWLNTTITRRDAIVATAKVGAAVTLSQAITLPFATTAQAQDTPIPKDANDETVRHSACLVNCGSRCPLKVIVKNDRIVRIEPEDAKDDAVFGEHQIRPCLRGRSSRWRVYSPDRIKYPMKRVGKRGEGKFKRISWDEATAFIAAELTRVSEQYGREAIYYNYQSGAYYHTQGRPAWIRLLNLTGGYLNYHNTYSTAQIATATPYTHGDYVGSHFTQIAHSDLVVLFGLNLSETRMSGGGQVEELRRALETSKARVIIIDPRYTDSVITEHAEWLPIRPTTDAALVAGIAHTLITEQLLDEALVNRYCVGYDRSTLPDTAAPNASYKDYVLGTGDDGIAKTPEWAADITGIKLFFNQAGNTLLNQHGETNRTRQILADESLCETIIVIENHMTPSAMYADLLLPETSYLEAEDLVDSSYAAGSHNYMIAIQKTVKPMWEVRSTYDICADIAGHLGLREQYTEGRTQAQWAEMHYQQIREKRPYLPEWSVAKEMGVIDQRIATEQQSLAFADFRADAEANPLSTPSGKIEIYSQALADLAQTWTLPEGERIPALPEFCPAKESHLNKALTAKYPLQLSGFHTKGHTHSTYSNVLMLHEAVPDEVWINPIDASARQLKSGDRVHVFNDRGVVELPCKVTQRILPGVAAMPQGAWTRLDGNGVDVGGCINTLTSHHPSPLAKGNPQHTNLVEIKRA
ncbi:molybdopterin-dependent oxidoreductase [Salmonella enterica subsp. enterica serovar Reading]|nr:molybdopterin-dependent oxidoreductase [Salmonella enterica subsp. enterica serovar Reading]